MFKYLSSTCSQTIVVCTSLYLVLHCTSGLIHVCCFLERSCRWSLAFSPVIPALLFDGEPSLSHKNIAQECTRSRQVQRKDLKGVFEWHLLEWRSISKEPLFTRAFWKGTPSLELGDNDHRSMYSDALIMVLYSSCGARLHHRMKQKRSEKYQRVPSRDLVHWQSLEHGLIVLYALMYTVLCIYVHNIMIYHAILISVSCHGHPSISQRKPCWQCLLPKASTKRARNGVACPRLSWNNVDTSWTCSPFAALASHLRAQLHSQGKSWFLSNGMVRDNWAAPRSIAQSQTVIFRGLQLAGISLPLCAPKSNCQLPFSKDVPGHSTASSGCLVHHGFILQVIHFCYCLQCWETGCATLIRIKFETNLSSISSMTRRWLFIAITATILHLSNTKADQVVSWQTQRVSFSAPCNSRENGHLHSGGDWASHPKGQVVHLEWSGGLNLM